MITIKSTFIKPTLIRLEKDSEEIRNPNWTVGVTVDKTHTHTDIIYIEYVSLWGKYFCKLYFVCYIFCMVVSQVLRPHSLLTNLVIDYEIAGGSRGDTYLGVPIPQESCDDAFLYLADTTSAALIVYDVRNDEAWRVFHPNMLPHPDHCFHMVSIHN